MLALVLTMLVVVLLIVLLTLATFWASCYFLLLGMGSSFFYQHLLAIDVKRELLYGRPHGSHRYGSHVISFS